MLDMVDGLHAVLAKLDREYELRYTKYYIGLERAGVVNNFMQFRPKQNFLKLTFTSEASPELEKAMDDAGLDVMGYEQKWHEYTVRVTPKDFQTHSTLLADIIKRAYESANAD